MEADGLVKRVVCPEVPLRTEYSLTPLGEALRKPLGSLCERAETQIGEMEKARVRSAPKRSSAAEGRAPSRQGATGAPTGPRDGLGAEGGRRRTDREKGDQAETRQGHDTSCVRGCPGTGTRPPCLATVRMPRGEVFPGRRRAPTRGPGSAPPTPRAT
ncbi:MAG: winged helix-turn-helix transcriptional regulator [Thermoanaerobaculia bacterium]